jgi:hypothetical protein
MDTHMEGPEARETTRCPCCGGIIELPESAIAEAVVMIKAFDSRYDDPEDLARTLAANILSNTVSGDRNL